MNSAKARGTLRVTDMRMGNYSKPEASALSIGRREWLGLRAASAMPTLSILLLLVLPAVAQAQFEYTVENDDVTITKYTGAGGDVVIPNTINGLPVAHIGDYAFSGFTGLTSVTIPDSVTSIGGSAFRGCTGLTSVTIPDSVTRIDAGVFQRCSSLTAITVDALNPAYSDVEGVLLNKTLTELIQCPAGKRGTYSIPDSVTGIDWSAFAGCTGLTSVTIPDSVTSIGGGIGGGTFSGCTGLTSVTIGNGVTSIGPWAFSGCTGLTSVTIGNRVTYIASYTFYGCTSLTSVAIPGSLRSFGDYAFYQCTGLTSVTIGNGVTSIGGGMFYGCTGLTSVTIPNSVTNIDWSAFSGCTGLTSVTIPQGVTSIGQHAFNGCAGLTSVTIPDSVTSFGALVFRGCSSLTAITVDALNPAYSDVEGVLFNKTLTKLIQCPAGKCGTYSIPDSVTDIWWDAFSGCAGLTSVTIPNSVTSIRSSAFMGCSSLTGVTIGNGVTSLESSTFEGCTSLTNITIPNSVTSIGDSAFSGCTGLTSVTIPDSVTTIGDSAFSGCTRLTDISIGYNLKSIASSAFNMCSNLTRLHFDGNAPSLVGEPVFEGISATVYYNPRTAGWAETYGGSPTVAVDKELVFAGLTIRGEVGRVYSIEHVTDLTDPAESDWRCLEYLRLPASPYSWADKFAPVTGKRFYRAVAAEPPANMVFIPPGTFRMGSPTNEVDRWDWEGPQTQVTISRGYWMGKYEVTQGEYEAVMGSNPSWFNGVRGAGEEWERDYGVDLNRPVETVSWDDATEYCAKLTARERAAGQIPSGSVYRLPTEAEWEYACRAWTSTRFSYGDDPGYTNLMNYAWHYDNNDGQTHPVGQKLPNPWGLYDMHGNVSEWCQDWLGDYAGGIALDPQWPDTGWGIVVRSGEWDYDAGSCRSASRDGGDPNYYYGRSGLGFRVVLAPGQP